MTASDICERGAVELSELIHSRRVTCEAVMRAYVERIDLVNPKHNAIVMRIPADELLAQAQVCDRELASGHSRGWLHGIPLAIKDTANVKGMPTTLGHAALKEALAPEDSPMVARLREAGALLIGKTNVPEFALGSHTYNQVFGVTRNALNPEKSAGGSSGGAAAALALQMLPVADGSDFMGSLRNPAAWNHVYGMRPSQGLVPFAPGADVWLDQLGTEGPMARHVRDLRAMLVTQSGFHACRPLSWSLTQSTTKHRADLKGVRIGWLGDLQGHLAMEPGVLNACESALEKMRAAGATIKPVMFEMDPEVVWMAWLVWRSLLVGTKIRPVVSRPGAFAQTKPEAIWELEQAQRYELADFMAASASRTAFYNAMLKLFNECDMLTLPSAQVWAFDVNADWPKHIGSRPMDTYHRWMEVTIYATFAGLPAASVPCGIDPKSGTGMGIQCIGRPHDDLNLLDMLQTLEEAIDKI